MYGFPKLSAHKAVTEIFITNKAKHVSISLYEKLAFVYLQPLQNRTEQNIYFIKTQVNNYIDI